MERDLVAHILKLKNDALQNLEIEYKIVKEEEDFKISMLDKAKQKIEEATCQIQTVENLDLKQKFIQSKLIENAVKETSELCEKWETKGCQSKKFKMDEEVKSSIMALTSLGSVQKIYRVKSEIEVNVYMENERYRCLICDICMMPDGTIIMADYHNYKLKRLDNNAEIKDYFDVEAHPTGICCTGDNEVAVKLANNKVQFISVGSSFSKLRDISITYGYIFGMMFCAGQLWISNGRNVDIYSTTGDLLKTVSAEVNDLSIFKIGSEQMANNGDTAVVADKTNGAICLRRDGTFKGELRDKRLRVTRGVFISSDGAAFYTGQRSDNIVMFDRDGRYLRELIGEDSGLKNPMSLLYDEERNCLVVGCFENTIKVYTI